MITAIVRIKVDADVTVGRVNALFQASLGDYQGLDGLIRKYYIFDAPSSTAGGVYLWAGRDMAEAVFTSEWRRAIAATFGAEPEVQYFDTPIVIDNETEDVLIVSD